MWMTLNDAGLPESCLATRTAQANVDAAEQPLISADFSGNRVHQRDICVYLRPVWRLAQHKRTRMPLNNR